MLYRGFSVRISTGNCNSGGPNLLFQDKYNCASLCGFADILNSARTVSCAPLCSFPALSPPPPPAPHSPLSLPIYIPASSLSRSYLHFSLESINYSIISFVSINSPIKPDLSQYRSIVLSRDLCCCLDTNVNVTDRLCVEYNRFVMEAAKHTQPIVCSLQYISTPYPLPSIPCDNTIIQLGTAPILLTC